uniref:C2H2-type domain-containing protein n=1 Tax=Panagrolaimus superbus TaxID=310955 RepID=A0A914YEH4_9BILA
MSKVSDETMHAIVKVSSKAEIIKLHQLLISEGFTDILIVKNFSCDTLTSSNEITISDDSKVVVPKRKAGGRKRLAREMLGNESDERGTPNAESESQNNLTAAVIAALSSITKGGNTTTNSSSNDEDGEQPASSSSTNSLAPSSEDTTTIASPIPFVARPRGSRMQVSDDPSIYAACKLCSNKIMSSRLSNLTNHVRRHASLKQYQCCHCGYSHNEMAKVRLHMQHNHQDYDSSPIDAMCREMQQQWANLMEQCFPGHAKRFAHNNSFVAAAAAAALANEDVPTQVKTPDILEISREETPKPQPEIKFDISEMYRPVSPSEIFCCSQCGEFVQSAKLMTHLVDTHPTDCHSFACSECEYVVNAPWKVTLHIRDAHNDDGVAVMTPTGTNYVVCVPLFFPDFAQRRGYTLEDEILRHEFVAKFSTQLNRDLNALKAIQCEFCFKLFTSDQNISKLLDHAAIHFGIKHYSCPECKYHSSEISVVYSHIDKRHPNCASKFPIDSSINENIPAWHKLSCLCFPTLSDAFIEMSRIKSKSKIKRRGGGGSNSNDSNNLGGGNNDVGYLDEESSTSSQKKKQQRNSTLMV